MFEAFAIGGVASVIGGTVLGMTTSSGAFSGVVLGIIAGRCVCSVGELTVHVGPLCSLVSPRVGCERSMNLAGEESQLSVGTGFGVSRVGIL